MSFTYFDYQTRKQRRQETVYDLQAPPAPQESAQERRSEPMEVQEDPLSETGILRFLRRLAR